MLAACARGRRRRGGVMREVTHGDIRAAARVLLGHPDACWPEVMAEMLSEAHQADCYRKARGRHHPQLGNGTLMSAALARAPAPAPAPGEGAHLAALGAAIEAVLDWRAQR